MLGFGCARANRRPEAVKILRQLERWSGEGLASAFDLASLHIALSEPEKALAWLERGYVKRDQWLIELQAWPWFDSLRSDARFQDLLRRIGILD